MKSKDLIENTGSSFVHFEEIARGDGLYPSF